MTHEALLNAWRAGRPAAGGWISGGGPFSWRLYRNAGYDYVGIDCQHGAMDETQAAQLLMLAEGNSCASIVRVSRNNSALIGRVADAGADGVIVPMVNTPSDAAKAVAAVNYPPAGVRSFGPMRRDLVTADLGELAARVSIFAMIETVRGLDQVGEICKVPGLSGIYIGPADLSISLGLDPALAFTTDQLLAPIQRIVAACAEGGIVPGIHQITPTGVVRWAKAGMKLITLGSDTGLFMRAAIDDLREISTQLHWNLLSEQPPG